MPLNFYSPRPCVTTFKSTVLATQRERIFTGMKFLYSQESSHRMDEIIHRLLMYTIGNGVLTTLGTLLAMVFVRRYTNTLIFGLDSCSSGCHIAKQLSLHRSSFHNCQMCVFLLLCLLTKFWRILAYLNSLLATLNSRDALKKRDGSEPVAYQISVEGHSQPRFRRYTVSTFLPMGVRLP